MFLDEAIRQAQAAAEQKFLFRKIGLPFDYASQPDDFPSKAFANAKEARSNLPNPDGLGSGFHFSCRLCTTNARARCRHPLSPRLSCNPAYPRVIRCFSELSCDFHFLRRLGLRPATTCG